MCCQGRYGGRAVSPSCNFRYEIAHFYGDPAANSLTPLQPSPKPQPPASQEGLVSPPPSTNTSPRKGLAVSLGCRLPFLSQEEDLFA
ncbi:hypothetical protein Q3G72_013074 [Acer saccharum]|nr:hypothetical protein Q3G72_013074 [Acer saccharum]